MNILSKIKIFFIDPKIFSFMGLKEFFIDPILTNPKVMKKFVYQYIYFVVLNAKFKTLKYDKYKQNIGKILLQYKGQPDDVIDELCSGIDFITKDGIILTIKYSDVTDAMIYNKLIEAIKDSTNDEFSRLLDTKLSSITISKSYQEYCDINLGGQDYFLWKQGIKTC